MSEVKLTGVVMTSTGPIVGKVLESGRVSSFLGIPYAQPPIGALRFKATQPVKPWQTPFEATQFGSPSLQMMGAEHEVADFIDENTPVGEGYFGSEDCLTLNVWKPENEQAKRPLFIWIHGGANHMEGSRSRMYNGEVMAEQGNIVFASLNYRLGMMGFMDVSELGGEDYLGSSCNGLMDQLMAVEWILSNAEAFGADPGNVTIAGESAGGMDISWLLASGRLKGKVKRAILMSNVKGPAGFGEAPNKLSRHDKRFSQTIAKQFMARLGYDSFEVMQADAAQNVFNRLANSVTGEDHLFDLDGLFYPCVDEVFSDNEPYRAIRAGMLDGIDIMLGYTNYEAGLWVMAEEAMLNWPAQKMADLYGNLSDRVKEKVVAQYRTFHPTLSEGELGLMIMSDCGFVSPITWFAEEMSARQNKVWMYRFDWEVNSTFKAMHSCELPFFFGRPNDEAACELIQAPANSEQTQERETLSQAFFQRVLSFIHHGTPNANPTINSLNWPLYESNTRSVMRFDLDCEVIQQPNKEKHNWWTEHVYAPLMNPTNESA
ncbi:carboxylesterase/lipase family protein [Rhodanobacter aciditrophus]|uniref:Carboxylesterase/lipase family protein n=1 Tax=Rhodanobacter aciditrophus TaxID=1623218 RepID=A0ABW4AW73_9GAMM